VRLIRVTRSTLIRRAKDGMSDRRRETSIYVCSTEISAEKTAEAIHSHRGVENHSHYVRDVAMQENACRIRTSPGIFARARRFARNILRANHENNIANACWCNALDIKRVLQYRFK
jgi:predicted transposase YbfD/YdcC